METLTNLKALVLIKFNDANAPNRFADASPHVADVLFDANASFFFMIQMLF